MRALRPRKRPKESEVETIVIDKRIWAVLHNMCNRLTALETALARLEKKPRRRTSTPKKSVAASD